MGLEKIKVPRPVDPIGSALFDAIFGTDKQEGEIDVGPEKAREVGDNIKGLFTVSTKLAELVEILKESNTLLKEANTLGETLKESNKLIKESNKLIIKTNERMESLEAKLIV